MHYLEQNIDHFNWAPPLGDAQKTTYAQRYFVNDQYWDKDGHGPVFFYFGNEDNVELYVNHTGLMWESAAAFKALWVTRFCKGATATETSDAKAIGSGGVLRFLGPCA